MKYLILFAFFINTCSADVNVKYLEANTPAPFTGYLFTPEKTNELRINDQELNYEKALNLHLGNINKLQEDNLTILQEKLAKQDNSIFAKAGYFLFGSILTGFLAYGIYRTSK